MSLCTHISQLMASHSWLAMEMEETTPLDWLLASAHCWFQWSRNFKSISPFLSLDLMGMSCKLNRSTSSSRVSFDAPRRGSKPCLSPLTCFLNRATSSSLRRFGRSARSGKVAVKVSKRACLVFGIPWTWLRSHWWGGSSFQQTLHCMASFGGGLVFGTNKCYGSQKVNCFMSIIIDC